jgi:hypothetical protein
MSYDIKYIGTNYRIKRHAPDTGANAKITITKSHTSPLRRGASQLSDA